MKPKRNRIKYVSLARPGLNAVITPHNSICRVAQFYRLNLRAGQSRRLASGNLEMNLALIRGEVVAEEAGRSFRLRRLDSLYLPGGTTIRLSAVHDAIVYIGAAPYAGIGRLFRRCFDANLPLGNVRQVHGKPPFERDVFMTLDPQTPASRLICGYTWGRDGGWTSWPPHQHGEHLEEIYCYFDLEPPHYGLQLGYPRSGDTPEVCVVRSGDAVIVPRGYHPTVAIPGSRNVYFWILAALRPSSRRYDLAKQDPRWVPAPARRKTGGVPWK